MSWSAFTDDVLAKIYFAAAPSAGLVKIGITAKPIDRLRGLLAWSPVPLQIEAQVAGTVRDENFIHHLLIADWSHFEWFHLRTPLKTLLRDIAERGALPGYARAPADWSRRRLPHQHQGRKLQEAA